MKINYRPEIDGLRAISVFAVILYHANFVLFEKALFPGGFIGVDIFFVISGYLITKIIINEIYKTNQFSFKNFYERRVRRILPTLLLVLIVTSIVSFFILLPRSLIDYGMSLLSSIFFISNFYFWITGGRYGDDSELLRPLLHTWSLSVEEQFYIFFPIFLLVIFKFFKKNLIIILFIIFFISLIFAQWSSGTDLKITFNFFSASIIFFDKFNFYSIQSRIFELLIGSLLSYFELKNKKRHLSYSLLNKIFPGLGMVLIFYSFIFFNLNKILHPSFITLIPLIGVSLIILFSKKGELITKLLSSKIFLFFGIISYSLYLWHYPIFSFFRYTDIFNNSIQIKLFAIILAIILSALSYYFIEIPFRNKNIISLKKLITCIVIASIILLSYCFYIFKTEGIKNRFPNIIGERLRADVKENQLSRIKGNYNNLFLIGDSHAITLKYHLNKKLIENSYNFYFKNTFLYLKNFNLVDNKKGLVDKNYFETNESIHKFLRENKNLIVVWKHRWTFALLQERFDNEEGNFEYQTEHDRYLDFHLKPINIKFYSKEEKEKYIEEGIKSSAKEILEMGHVLILVYPVPEMGFDPQKLIIKKNNFIYFLNKKTTIPILSTSYEVYKKRHKKIFEILDSIQHPNVYRIYPDFFFCNTVVLNRCVANNTKHLFYFDQDHLSLEGTSYIVNDIIKVVLQLKN